MQRCPPEALFHKAGGTSRTEMARGMVYFPDMDAGTDWTSMFRARGADAGAVVGEKISKYLSSWGFARVGDGTRETLSSLEGSVFDALSTVHWPGSGTMGANDRGGSTHKTKNKRQQRQRRGRRSGGWGDDEWAPATVATVAAAVTAGAALVTTLVIRHIHNRK